MIVYMKKWYLWKVLQWEWTLTWPLYFILPCDLREIADLVPTTLGTIGPTLKVVTLLMARAREIRPTQQTLEAFNPTEKVAAHPMAGMATRKEVKAGKDGRTTCPLPTVTMLLEAKEPHLDHPLPTTTLTTPILAATTLPFEAKDLRTMEVPSVPATVTASVPLYRQIYKSTPLKAHQKSTPIQIPSIGGCF